MINGELIVDNFAGGGGASTGIELATGYSVDIAINHDPEAIRMHQTNHPNTKHYCEDVWMVDPVKVCNGRPVGLAWFSPDCKHFSKAKGGKPKDKNIRGLAWVACRWAGLVRPRVIMLENVEEFKGWGPLNRQHHPIKAKRGTTFQKFVHQLNDLGYEVQYRELIAADYGAPTTRKRFFLIARCDGKPIVWPSPTHAPADSPEVKNGHLKPYLGAYTQIDFQRPCPSIFDTAEGKIWHPCAKTAFSENDGADCKRNPKIYLREPRTFSCPMQPRWRSESRGFTHPAPYNHSEKWVWNCAADACSLQIRKNFCIFAQILFRRI